MTDTDVRPVTVMAGRLLALRDDLARVHDWLATMWPADLPVPHASGPDHGALMGLAVYCDGPDNFRRAVRALTAGVGTVDKEASESYMRVLGMFGAVEVRIIADRDQVCTRRQVGTTTEVRPAEDAPMVEVEVPVYVWDCEPIMAAEREHAAHNSDQAQPIDGAECVAEIEVVR